MTKKHQPGERPWERQTWDTDASFAAFQAYLRTRSVPEAYRQKPGKSQAKQAPGVWNNWAAAKNAKGKLIPGALTWKQRAAAWDDHLARQERQGEEEERRRWRKWRRDLLQAHFNKVLQAMKAADVEGVDLAKLTAAVRTVMDQSRQEFDDLPAQRLEHTGSVTTRETKVTFYLPDHGRD